MVGEGGGLTARLVVADEHPVVRRAVRMSCDASSGLEVVGEADTGFDVLTICEELRPDVAVLDIAMPDGLDAIREITREAPRHLSPGGWLLLEHGMGQDGHVRALLSQAGLEEVDSCPDLARIPRVAGGKVK